MANTLVLFTYFISAAFCAPTQWENIQIISRKQWDARDPVHPATKLSLDPPPFVVIHHSATPSCLTQKMCIRSVKAFQNYHIDTNHFDDIGYNFVVGEDGNIYEGRGWGKMGAHTKGLNSQSIGIAIVGDFRHHMPNDEALTSLRKLIAFGVLSGDIDPDYKIIGHRQASATECPGTTFYNDIKTWEHWLPEKRIVPIDVRSLGGDVHNNDISL